jgi:hypothetical protein
MMEFNPDCGAIISRAIWAVVPKSAFLQEVLEIHNKNQDMKWIKICVSEDLIPPSPSQETNASKVPRH